MYSKKLLKKYIQERLNQTNGSYYQLSKAIDMTHSNLSRALESDTHNMTLAQFATLVNTLELTPEQVYHILTGKKKKEATLQLVRSAIEKLIKE